jgi:hypothetical protein
MILFKDDNLTIEYNEEVKIYTFTIHYKSIGDDEFIRLLGTILAVLKEKRPSYYISDHRQGGLLSVKSQSYVNEIFFPQITDFVKQIAFIVPKDIFAKAAQGNVVRKNKNVFIVEFETLEEGISWAKEKTENEHIQNKVSV